MFGAQGEEEGDQVTRCCSIIMGKYDGLDLGGSSTGRGGKLGSG